MILEIALALVLAITFFTIIIYPKLLDYLSKKNEFMRIEHTPKISIIVPAYNEEKYISRKIKNLKELDYPKNKFEIIVVDNSSIDRTMSIAKKFGVKVFSSEKGKINALNKGLANAKYNIIAITDADTVLSKNALRSSVQLLHSNISAVNASIEVGQKPTFYSKSKLNYHKNDWKMRYKEGLLDTVCSLDGKFIVFNKKNFKKFKDNTILDDLNLTIELRKIGLRSVVDNQSIAYEESPSNIYEELKQIRRRMSIGFVELLNSNSFSMLFNKKYGYFGNLIFPVRRFVPFLIPFFCLFTAFYLFAKMNFFLALFIMLMGLILIMIFNPYLLIQLAGVFLSWIDILSGKIRNPFYWSKIKS